MSLALRRVLAFAGDWFVVAAWGGALFGLVMFVTAGQPTPPPSPWVGQVIGFLAMTAPVTLYFAAFESSAFQATPGKRLLGLRVLDERGERLHFGHALLRNGLKFVPWEAGHTVAQQAFYSGETGLPAWVLLFAVISFAGPLWWLGALATTGRTPYDRWSGAQVLRRTE